MLCEFHTVTGHSQRHLEQIFVLCEMRILMDYSRTCPRPKQCSLLGSILLSFMGL